MADLQDMLLFVNYNDRNERVVLPRNNPFDDYDERKFRERFRLSKTAVSKLLEQVNKQLLCDNVHRIKFVTNLQYM